MTRQLTHNGLPKPTRARLWVALRANQHRAIDLGLLSDYAGAHPDAVLHHLQGLVRAGYVAVTKIKAERGKTYTQPKHLYRLIKDVGVDAPLIRHDGTVSVVGVKNANMWRTMRVLRTFSHQDVQAHASTSTHDISVDSARKYLKMLEIAGYVQVVTEAVMRGKNSERTCKRYQLIRDTGPRAPMIQKLKTVYDQNLNKVMFQEEVGNDDE